jgi:hypothetical protein
VRPNDAIRGSVSQQFSGGQSFDAGILQESFGDAEPVCFPGARPAHVVTNHLHRHQRDLHQGHVELEDDCGEQIEVQTAQRG